MATRVFKLGAAATDTPGDLVAIISTPGASSKYMTAEAPLGTDYSVPASKTLYITRIGILVDGAGNAAYFGYGDDGVASGAAAPTNWKQLSNKLSSDLAGRVVYHDVAFTVPTGKFPCFLSDASGNTVYCAAYGIVY